MVLFSPDLLLVADDTVATQLGQIVRVDPDGEQTTMSTGTLGDAAVVFGRTGVDLRSIYVVNNGRSFIAPPDSLCKSRCRNRPLGRPYSCSWRSSSPVI